MRFARLAEEAARVATGLLGWDPERFWTATPQELLTALEGRLGVTGSDRPLTAPELAALMERMRDG